MKTSASIINVSAALIAAKKKFAIAQKTGFNTHLNSHYSNLTDVLNAIEPALKEYDLMVVQSNLESTTEKVMHIETLVLHSSGEWLAFQYNMPIEKITAQAYGSTTSYGRRYALCAALSITQSDDDAEIAKRSAADYKGVVESITDKDKLKAMYSQAKQTLSAAEWKIAEGYFTKRSAELNATTSRGFSPAKPEIAKKDEPEQVDESPQDAVQSESQTIEDF